MTKNLKYTLLLALFCSMQIPAQAGWRYNLFESMVNMGMAFYPLNMLSQSFDYLKEMTRELRTPVDNTGVKNAYPHAFAYVEKQLKAAEININHTQIEDTKIEYSRCGFRKLFLPLSVLERESTAPSSRLANQAKGAIAHEIGHLIRHSALKYVAASGLAMVGTELCARHIPIMRTKIIGTILKTMCSKMLFRGYAHFDEYQADSAAIEQVKNNRQILSDKAIFYLDTHADDSRAIIHGERDRLIRLFYSPKFMACVHAVFDVHASFFSRANRLLNAAGIACNQRLLAHLLKKQLVEHLSKNWQEKAQDIDTSPIIEILKQPREKIIADYGIDPGLSREEQAKALDSVEIPYPLQTYGQ